VYKVTTQRFTVVGVILLAVLFWMFSQTASGEARRAYNLFLITLLVSMVLTKWSVIKPLIIKTTEG